MPQDVQGCYYKLKGPKVVVACITAKPTKTRNNTNNVRKAERAYSRIKYVNQMRS
jgi:hypothetical protein